MYKDNHCNAVENSWNNLLSVGLGSWIKKKQKTLVFTLSLFKADWDI